MCPTTWFCSCTKITDNQPEIPEVGRAWNVSLGHRLVCVPNMSHKNVSAWVNVSWTAPRWSHFSTTVQTTIETWLNYGHFWFRSFRLTDYLLGCQFEENRKLVSGNKNSLIFVSLVLRDDCALSSLISEIHEPLDELQRYWNPLKGHPRISGS